MYFQEESMVFYQRMSQKRQVIEFYANHINIDEGLCILISGYNNVKPPGREGKLGWSLQALGREHIRSVVEECPQEQREGTWKKWLSFQGQVSRLDWLQTTGILGSLFFSFQHHSLLSRSSCHDQLLNFWGDHKRIAEVLELELQVVMGAIVCVLGTQIWWAELGFTLALVHGLLQQPSLWLSGDRCAESSP